MKYTITIPDLSLEQALEIADNTAGSLIYTDQDGKNRGETPHQIHGKIESLHAYPTRNELLIKAQ